jgi:ADP-dependent NAD(P)H-hydrate dehydratase / NAD(P)H-hydrate epimerase
MNGVRPPLRPFVRGTVAALTGREAAAWDKRAVDEVGVPERVLMESAGRAAADVIERLYPDGVVIGLIGSGNNGGDALVALRTLAARGRSVRAVLVGDRPDPDPLSHGWSVWCAQDRELEPDGWAPLLSTAAVVVDGMLGTGVRGAPRERQAAAIRALNDFGPDVVAMDVPSGIDPETGAVPGEAVHAAVTVAFGAPKLGSLLHPARALAGRIVAVEIGFPPLVEGEAGAFVTSPDWVRARIPVRAKDTHKNAVGRVAVLGGGAGMAGAVVLAARGALRAGAGIVRVVTGLENRPIVQAALPEAIHVDAADRAAVMEALEASDAVVVGPGLGTDAAASAVVEAVAAGPALPALVDADALNLAAAGSFDLSAFAGRRPVLLTPHPGEMRRLLGDEVPDDRVSIARAAAERFGCAILYKGAPSMVTDAAGPLRVDTQGSSDLASAGMGDTLAGVCGTLLAQGLAPVNAGAAGLFLCGRAAWLAGKGSGLTPSDVLDHLPVALAERERPSDLLGLPCVVFDADPAH